MFFAAAVLNPDGNPSLHTRRATIEEARADLMGLPHPRALFFGERGGLLTHMEGDSIELPEEE